MTTQTQTTFTKIDKALAVGLTVSVLLTIFGFFGIGGFAVIGAIAVAVVIIAGLCWLNEKTGGFVGFALALISLT